MGAPKNQRIAKNDHKNARQRLAEEILPKVYEIAQNNQYIEIILGNLTGNNSDKQVVVLLALNLESLAANRHMLSLTKALMITLQRAGDVVSSCSWTISNWYEELEQLVVKHKVVSTTGIDSPEMLVHNDEMVRGLANIKVEATRACEFVEQLGRIRKAMNQIDMKPFKDLLASVQMLTPMTVSLEANENLKAVTNSIETLIKDVTLGELVYKIIGLDEPNSNVEEDEDEPPF